MNFYITHCENCNCEISAVASLSLPGGQGKIISSVSPHFAIVFLIFPQIFFIFFLILVFPVDSSPTCKSFGYATLQDGTKA